MRKVLFMIAIVEIVVLLPTGTVVAHHAFAAEFDANKPIMLRGTVTKVDWVNPHTWIYLDVKGRDGRIVNWAVEGGPPNSLLRRGLRRTILPIGAEIVVQGYQAKNGTPRANGRDVTFADGRVVFMGSSGTGAPYDAKPK